MRLSYQKLTIFSRRHRKARRDKSLENPGVLDMTMQRLKRFYAILLQSWEPRYRQRIRMFKQPAFTLRASRNWLFGESLEQLGVNAAEAAIGHHENNVPLFEARNEVFDDLVRIRDVLRRFAESTP